MEFERDAEIAYTLYIQTIKDLDHTKEECSKAASNKKMYNLHF